MCSFAREYLMGFVKGRTKKESDYMYGIWTR